MATLEETTKFAGDVFIHFESMEYCTRGEKLTAQDTTVNLDSVVGYPVIFNGGKYKLAKAGDEANVVGLVVRGDPIVGLLTTADTAKKYQIALNPPIIINQDKLPTVDYADAAFTIATIVTALKALKWEVRKEPAFSTTQTLDS